MTAPVPEDAFPAHPYPGARPEWSYAHVDGLCWPLRPDHGTSWGWRMAVDDSPLDDWLAARHAPSLAERIPVLAYGSNVCPGKIGWLRARLGLTGPVVVVRARCTGLAAVWATGIRAQDGQRPATLAAAPDSVEWHGVWLATPDQVAVLDRCEGRDVRYRLVRLRSGRVETETGSVIDGALVYSGQAPHRVPLLAGNQPHRCATVPQTDAVRLVGTPGGDGLDVRAVHGMPHADEWPDRLFVYGTLRPDSTAWSRVAGLTLGPPQPAHLDGKLYDTGRGYPALRLDTTRRGRGVGDPTPGVPGWVLRLRSPVPALAALDRYEGDEYRRTRVVLTGGQVCWTYLWDRPVTGMRELPHGWC